MPRITSRTDPSGREHFWTHYNSWDEFITAAQAPQAWNGHQGSAVLPTKVHDRARYGWPEGRARLRAFDEKLDLRVVHAPSTRFAQSMDIGGMMPDVPSYVAGAPDHMIDLGDQHIASHPILRLQVNIDSPSWIGGDWMENQAIAVCSLCDILETQGYQCEIRLANATFASGGGKPSLTMYTCAFKSAGEVLDRDRAVYALGHPEVLRQFLFRIYQTDPGVGVRFRRTMGSPTDEIPLDYTDPGAINLPPADRHCTTVPVALQRLIEVVKGAQPEVDWSILDYVLERLEAMVEAEALKHSGQKLN